jgi:methylated-DNA-[protein]-cysteine S-methyltransferase
MLDNDIRDVVFETSLGWIGVRTTANGVHSLAFDCDSPRLAQQSLSRHRPAPTVRNHATSCPSDRASLDLITELQSRLQCYAAGRSVSFADVPLDLSGTTEFQQRVWLACRTIPLGQTWSYAQLATEVGSPRAARAVGSAMARNRIPLIIPCHRVVGGNGRLGGFSSRSGLAMNRRLLALEAGGRGRARGCPSSMSAP